MKPKIDTNNLPQYNTILNALFGRNKYAYCGSFAMQLLGLLDRPCNDIDIILLYKDDFERNTMIEKLSCLARIYQANKYLSDDTVTPVHNAIELDGITYDIWIKQFTKADVNASLEICLIEDPKIILKEKMQLNRPKDWDDFDEIMSNIHKVYGSFKDFLDSISIYKCYQFDDEDPDIPF